MVHSSAGRKYHAARRRLRRNRHFKAWIHEGLAAFRRFRGALGVMFSANDKIVMRPARRATHTGSYGGTKVGGGGRWSTTTPFGGVEDGNSAEISAIHGPLVPLKQIGYRREDVLAAPPGRAGGGPRGAAGAPHVRTRHRSPALTRVLSVCRANR